MTATRTSSDHNMTAFIADQDTKNLICEDNCVQEDLKEPIDADTSIQTKILDAIRSPLYQHIQIYGYLIDKDFLHEITEALKKCDKLLSLDLINCGLSKDTHPENLTVFKEFFECCVQHVKKLDLSWNALTGDHLQHIINKLDSTKKEVYLESIHLYQDRNENYPQVIEKLGQIDQLIKNRNPNGKGVIDRDFREDITKTLGTSRETKSDSALQYMAGFMAGTISTIGIGSIGIGIGYAIAGAAILAGGPVAWGIAAGIAIAGGLAGLLWAHVLTSKPAPVKQSASNDCEKTTAKTLTALEYQPSKKQGITVTNPDGTSRGITQTKNAQKLEVAKNATTTTHTTTHTTTPGRRNTV